MLSPRQIAEYSSLKKPSKPKAEKIEKSSELKDETPEEREARREERRKKRQEREARKEAEATAILGIPRVKRHRVEREKEKEKDKGKGKEILVVAPLTKDPKREKKPKIAVDEAIDGIQGRKPTMTVRRAGSKREVRSKYLAHSSHRDGSLNNVKDSSTTPRKHGSEHHHHHHHEHSSAESAIACGRCIRRARKREERATTDAELSDALVEPEREMAQRELRRRVDQEERLERLTVERTRDRDRSRRGRRSRSRTITSRDSSPQPTPHRGPARQVEIIRANDVDRTPIVRQAEIIPTAIRVPAEQVEIIPARQEYMRQADRTAQRYVERPQPQPPPRPIEKPPEQSPENIQVRLSERSPTRPTERPAEKAARRERPVVTRRESSRVRAAQTTPAAPAPIPSTAVSATRRESSRVRTTQAAPAASRTAAAPATQREGSRVRAESSKVRAAHAAPPAPAPAPVPAPAIRRESSRVRTAHTAPPAPPTAAASATRRERSRVRAAQAAPLALLTAAASATRRESSRVRAAHSAPPVPTPVVVQASATHKERSRVRVVQTLTPAPAPAPALAPSPAVPLPPVPPTLQSVPPTLQQLQQQRSTERERPILGFEIEEKPEKLIECVTCLDDEIPVKEAAKLACGHWFCNECLKRLFMLSLTDPAHMPPKCCTSDHIPLKHVQNLLSYQNKKLWNKKYLEYTTANRIYCPTTDCGEWVQPKDIHNNIGTCRKCMQQVCATCNGRAHGDEDCPQDPDMLKFFETAEKHKYQKCYNCKAMVELERGCNHMTCHCTAQFCYVCGSKWKACDCPWFNYEAGEAERGNRRNAEGAPRRRRDVDRNRHGAAAPDIDPDLAREYYELPPPLQIDPLAALGTLGLGLRNGIRRLTAEYVAALPRNEQVHHNMRGPSPGLGLGLARADPATGFYGAAARAAYSHAVPLNVQVPDLLVHRQPAAAPPAAPHRSNFLTLSQQAHVERYIAGVDIEDPEPAVNSPFQQQGVDSDDEPAASPVLPNKTQMRRSNSDRTPRKAEHVRKSRASGTGVGSGMRRWGSDAGRPGPAGDGRKSLDTSGGRHLVAGSVGSGRRR